MLQAPVTCQRFRPNRTFGMEWEYGTSRSKTVMKNALVRFNQEVTVTGYCHNSQYDLWYVKSDSSCGYEVASRVLGRMGYDEEDVNYNLQELKLSVDIHKDLYSRQCKVNERCGFHIHLGIGDYNGTEQSRLVRYWIKLEKMILDMMPMRRQDNHYCRVLSATGNVSPNSICDPSNFEGRMALNMSRRNHQPPSVEIRIAEASDDSRDVLNWTRFVLHLFAQIPNLPDPENCNWLTLEEGLQLLDLLGSGDSLIVLDPALSELRQWVLARTAAYANFQDAVALRARAKTLETKLYQYPYGTSGQGE